MRLLGGSSACSKAATCTEQHKHRRGHTSLPRVGFDITIPVFRTSKILRALDCAATVTGRFVCTIHNYLTKHLMTWKKKPAGRGLMEVCSWSVLRTFFAQNTSIWRRDVLIRLQWSVTCWKVDRMIWMPHISWGCGNVQGEVFPSWAGRVWQAGDAVQRLHLRSYCATVN